MSESNGTEFVLYHPDRSGVVRVRAESVEDFGDSMRLWSDREVVAISHPIGLAVNARNLVDSPPLPRHLVPPPAPLPVPPPMRVGAVSGVRQLCLATLLMGALALGFCGGFGMAMSHAVGW